jgi:DNA-binding NarL/FixJ family response regulator
VRVVIAEDMTLLRVGLARILTDHGLDVCGEAQDARSLLAVVDSTRPDVALIDIKMPPTHTDEGLQAARQIGIDYPETAVLMLSSYLESEYATWLLQNYPGGSGYLLKDRVSDPAVLIDAIHRVADGECVIDPAIVKRLLGRDREAGPLDSLSEREREVLGLMAEGHSNSAICEMLTLSPRTVETHIRNVFNKLALPESPESSRRVLAVLTFLRA